MYISDQMSVTKSHLNMLGNSLFNKLRNTSITGSVVFYALLIVALTLLANET